MSDAFPERLLQWQEKVRADLRKRWWGLVLLGMTFFAVQMVLSRVVNKANSFFDAHANLRLFIVSGSIWRSLLGSAIVCLIGIFLIIIHAYFETRPKKIRNAGIGGPEIRLMWGIPKDFLAIGVHKKRLILENRSDKDAYRVQIENVSVDRNQVVTATFAEINLLAARATHVVESKIIGRVEQHYINDFEMVWANADEIPDKCKNTDESGTEWLKIPIRVTFADYGGKKYRAIFEFVDDQSWGVSTEVRFDKCENL